MSDPRLSTGIYICDGCDNPCEVARLIVLAPNPEALKQFKDPETIQGIILAFCEPCLANHSHVKKSIRDLCVRYNQWIKTQQT